ncbi:uncharacterized protein LOC135686445 [Rhopilema esculentum]|uniref:uncharacterized protein LOC135686445 n=1 Tax=Rhopilema esculentum TaxID=499914 RepID=UPI0031D413EA
MKVSASLIFLLSISFQIFNSLPYRHRQGFAPGSKIKLGTVEKQSDWDRFHRNGKNPVHFKTFQNKKLLDGKESKHHFYKTDESHAKDVKGRKKFGKPIEDQLDNESYFSGESHASKKNGELFQDSFQNKVNEISSDSSATGNTTPKIGKVVIAKHKSNDPSHAKWSSKQKNRVSKAVVILLSVISALIVTVLLIALCSNVSPRFADWMARRNRVGYIPLNTIDLEDGQRKTVGKNETVTKTIPQDAYTKRDQSSNSDEHYLNTNSTRSASNIQESSGTIGLNQSAIRNSHSDTGIDCESSKDIESRDEDITAPVSLDMSSLSMIYMGIYNVIETDSSSDGSSSPSSTSSEIDVIKQDTTVGCSDWPSYVAGRIKNKLPRKESAEKRETGKRFVALDKVCASVLAKDVITPPENVQMPIRSKETIALPKFNTSSDDRLYKQGIYETFTSYKDGFTKKKAGKIKKDSLTDSKEVPRGDLTLAKKQEQISFEGDSFTNAIGQNYLEPTGARERINALLEKRKRFLDGNNTLARSSHFIKGKTRLDSLTGDRRHTMPKRQVEALNYKFSYGCYDSEEEEGTIDIKQRLFINSRKTTERQASLANGFEDKCDATKETSLEEQDSSVDWDELIAERVKCGLETKANLQVSKEELHGLQDAGAGHSDHNHKLNTPNEEDHIPNDKAYGNDLPTISEMAKKQIKVYDAVMRGDLLSPSCHGYEELAACLKNWRDEIGPVRSVEDWGDYNYTPACLRYETPLPLRDRTKGSGIRKGTLLGSRSSNSLFEGDGPETCKKIWTALEHLVDNESVIEDVKNVDIERNTLNTSLKNTTEEHTEASKTVDTSNEVNSQNLDDRVKERLANENIEDMHSAVNTNCHIKNDTEEKINSSNDSKRAETSFDDTKEREVQKMNAFYSEKDSEIDTNQGFSKNYSENGNSESTRDAVQESDSNSSSTSSLWNVTTESSTTSGSLASALNECFSVDDICHYSEEFVLTRDVAVKENQSNYSKTLQNEFSRAMLPKLALKQSSAFKAFGHLRRSMSDSGISILSRSAANTSTIQDLSFQKNKATGVLKSNSNIEIQSGKTLTDHSAQSITEATNIVSDKCLQVGKAGRFSKKRWKFIRRMFRSKKRGIELASNKGWPAEHEGIKSFPKRKRFFEKTKNKT